jgi:hypothetical protein
MLVKTCGIDLDLEHPAIHVVNIVKEQITRLKCAGSSESWNERTAKFPRNMLPKSSDKQTSLKAQV